MTGLLQPLLIDADSIFDTVREPLLVLSADLRLCKANDSFYKTFQTTPEETLGRLIFDLGDHQWRAPELQTLLKDILSKNTEFHDFEIIQEFPGIGPKTMLLNARRISNGSEPTPFILLAIDDITERRRSRHFNFAHDLLCVGTVDGFFVDVNIEFQKVLGYSREELLSKPFVEFVHPEDRAETARVMDQLRSGHDLARFQNRYRCRNGTYRYFDWTCPAPLIGEHVLYSAARDITDLVQIDRERLRLNDELTRSNADLEQFAYVASHDLQEPLRAVAGCVQIIQKRFKGKLDSSADELIGHAVDGATRMQNLIGDLLEYSRISRKGGAFVHTDLNVALEQALKNLEISLHETDALVTHDSLPTVVADRGQMTRLFQNLLSNALKFRGASKPIIHVSAEHKDKAWRVSVRDNGIGIQKEYLERVFILFQRLHTRTEYPGTGIGLAICKRIVERHDGRITVESEPGVGSTFSFTLLDQETEQ
jgi:PAS domain S-box-containing protein